MEQDHFFNFELTTANLDRFFIRQSIFEAINLSKSNFNGSLLDIGCGKMPYKKYLLENSAITAYVGLDIENALEYKTGIKPDHTWDGITMPFGDNSFDCAFGTEVLEHCPFPNITLKEVNRVLKPGGVFFFTVPFIWPLHEVPYDEFRYTPFSMERLLKDAGFSVIDIKATGGWHASLAQMLGLWVKRSPLTPLKKKYFSLIFKPIIKKLLKWDKHIAVNFSESQMITGLYGVAYK